MRRLRHLRHLRHQRHLQRLRHLRYLQCLRRMHILRRLLRRRRLRRLWRFHTAEIPPSDTQGELVRSAKIQKLRVWGVSEWPPWLFTLPPDKLFVEGG